MPGKYMSRRDRLRWIATLEPGQEVKLVTYCGDSITAQRAAIKRFSPTGLIFLDSGLKMSRAGVHLRDDAKLVIYPSAAVDISTLPPMNELK